MKSFMKLLLASIVSISVLVGCASKPAETEKPVAETGEVEPTETECKVKIGLVTDTGGVDDKSFNQSAWEGILRYADENNAQDCIKYLQSNTEADYIPNLSSFAEEGYDLTIAVGYLFQDAIDTVSKQYPDSNFLFIDSVSESENVRSATYAEEQGSYLVGIVAARKVKEDGSKTVGFVGGAQGELIGAFQAGFEQGVLAECPDCKIFVDYADSFSDDAKGQQLAVKQYDAGASAIYQAAGAAGNGVIKEARERGNVWAIGVDKDQYADGDDGNGKSIILTSMVKRVDISTYTTATDVLNGKFSGGRMVFDLSNDGVSAEITEGRNLTADDIAAVEKAAKAIKDGEVVVTRQPVIANGTSNK